MSRDLLTATGQALYGASWQAEMENDLDVSRRTLGRWLAETEIPPSGVYVDLAKLCRARIGKLLTLIEKLKEAQEKGKRAENRL